MIKRGSLFVAWALLGAVFTAGLFAALLPALSGLVLVLACLMLARFLPRSPEIIGLLAGLGLLCFVAAANTTGRSDIWIAVGAASVVVAVVAYTLVGRAHRMP